MNVPAVLGLVKVLRNPSLCLPHYTVPKFEDLPVPLSKAFAPHEESIDIRAVVLDKDNCFAAPHSNEVHPACAARFRELIKEFSTAGMLVVSNSSGLQSKDRTGDQARLLEHNTGVPVLRHIYAKPACGSEILDHFKGHVTSPSQIVVIGDRLLTDTALAHNMGARSIWVRCGVIEDTRIVTRFENWLFRTTTSKGYEPPRVPN